MKRLALAAAAVATIVLGGCAVYGPGYRYEWGPYAYHEYGYTDDDYPSATAGDMYYDQYDHRWHHVH